MKEPGNIIIVWLGFHVYLMSLQLPSTTPVVFVPDYFWSKNIISKVIYYFFQLSLSIDSKEIRKLNDSKKYITEKSC